MIFRAIPTFTVTIDVFAWMQSTSDASKQLLLAYLEDLSSSMDFRHVATAAAISSTPTLWFTFADEDDAADFEHMIDMLYRAGGWLVNDTQAR